MKDMLRKVLIVIAGIILNIAGRWIAGTFQLPIWFDMVGTFVASYFVGIWGGIVAGLSNNIISCVYDVTALVYSLTSVVAAFMMHIFVKKGYMNNALKAIVSSFWLGILCTVVSTPLNLIFYDGYSGNMWGDALVDMLRWHDVSGVLASLAGETVVEIVDKQVCVMLAFLIIHAAEYIKKRRRNRIQALAFMLSAGIFLSLTVPSLKVQAEGTESHGDNFIETVYDNTNGMVSSEANVICETDDGYIWIGSYAGLSRYDGNEFEFIREGGLVNVVGMMTDSKGRLWIGTNDAGIARYENGQYTYFTEADGLPANSIRCFAEDQEGNIYVGTSDKICRFRADDTIEVLEQDITFEKVMAVYRDMLIVMDNGGDIYALDGDKKITVAERGGKELFYYSMAVTSRGLMAGTDSGELFLIDITENEMTVKEEIHIGANEINAIFEDSRNRIWIATDTGFGYLDQNDNYQEIYCSGFASSVVCFHEDYQGNIWLASSRYGVMKLSESPFSNLFEKAGIENKPVNALLHYDGDYYCGTDDGLVILDDTSLISKTNELTEMTADSRVRALFEDKEGRLWLCSYNGLICYDRQNGIRCYNSESDHMTSDRFRCMTQLADGTLVAGTADGINFIRDNEVSGTMNADDGLANTQILSIVEGNDGTIWAGSDGSGIYVISDGKLIENYTIEDGLSSNIILRIVPYTDGYLIVTSNALCHIDMNGNIRRLEKFPYFNNYDVLIKDDIVYVTCSAGLYEVKLSDLCADEDTQYKLYNASEGLLAGLTANSWNYISEDGMMYLCSNSGVILYSTDNAGNDANMKYGIVSAGYDGTEIELSDENQLIIPANVKEMSVYASVRNYAFTDVKVRFYIKELDSNPTVYDWNSIEPVHIYKPDLSEYTLCLEILDSSGEEVLQESVYTISREMQLWEKTAFKTYLVLVCIEISLFTIISIVSMILVVLRKNELEKIRLELEEKTNAQTEELRIQQQEIKKLFIQTVTALSEAVDAKDRYTSGHSRRVAEYAQMIAAKMGKSKEEQEEIYRAGLLHDIGKIRIPVDIINKAGKLTDEEYNMIKIHPVTGYHILSGISGSNYIAIAAKYHHERFDGKGYPNGLMGDQIPEVARILGVADSYDAMTSNRSYREALPQDVVRNEIEKGKGTQFDPDIADIMLQMMDEDKDYKMRQAELAHRRILTVDDEAMNNKIIAHIMSDEPMYEVVSAGGGKEALEILEKQPFDLILLDVKMPEMDGLETLKRIREKYQTPVVLITGDRTLDASTEFTKLGFDDYITKPFLPQLIKEIVHNMTERIVMDSTLQEHYNDMDGTE